MMKKIIILEHNWGGRLANQLWNMANVYAFCLKNGYKLENRSFFRYDKSFNLPNRNIISRIFGFLDKFSNNPRRESVWYRRYTKLIKNIFPNNIVNDEGKVFDLDGLETTLDCDAFPLRYKARNDDSLVANRYGFSSKIRLSEEWSGAERRRCPASFPLETAIGGRTIYLTGWLFRSPESVMKYHKEIIRYLKPKKYIIEKVDNFIKELRRDTPLLVGIHIRQTDYKLVGDGSLFFKQEEVIKIIDDYLNYFNLDKNQVKFLICSDDKIDKNIFKGLNFSLGLGGEIEDMFSLAQTDLIIGSNSSYGGFSAYYGNIPIICFNRGSMDWESIRDKKNFEYYNNCTNMQF